MLENKYLETCKFEGLAYIHFLISLEDSVILNKSVVNYLRRVNITYFKGNKEVSCITINTLSKNKLFSYFNSQYEKESILGQIDNPWGVSKP